MCFGSLCQRFFVYEIYSGRKCSQFHFDIENISFLPNISHNIFILAKERERKKRRIQPFSHIGVLLRTTNTFELNKLTLSVSVTLRV